MNDNEAARVRIGAMGLKSLCALGLVLAAVLLAAGCGKKQPAPSADGEKIVTIALNWKPEPEFGGIYAAKEQGFFKAHGIDARIMPGGAGAPTWQMVGSGQADFGIASADEVAIARARGADVVALFATYQDCPQGIMVHQEKGYKTLGDVFAGGTLAIEKGLAYTRFLEGKYGFDRVKLVAFDGGIGTFLADKDYSQQCFVFSEPLAARRQGAKVRTFLIAESGYNPYTGVLIAKSDYVKANQATAEAVVKAVREGWKAYLADPGPANRAMGQLNKEMDAQTFADAAEAQKPLVLPEGMSPEQVGSMTRERWETLIRQLVDLKVLEKPVPAEECFIAM